MNNVSPLRPQAKVEIVKQSRDRWKDDAGALAQALDATAYATMHGDRSQQIQMASAARELLRVRRYPVRADGLFAFDVTVRTAQGYQYWQAVGRSSIDVLLATLEHFDGQNIKVSVRAGGTK